ncbi:MAG: hypothetical protein HY648_02470 [Acidobacteria bacterium]|nr:hypothetical protein [Acidobacteriota bacterium]
MPKLIITSSVAGIQSFQRVLLLMAAAFLAASVSAAAGPEEEAESGVFLIFSAGRPIGSEKFTIVRNAAGLEAKAELQLLAGSGPNSSERCTLQLEENLRPRFYERRQEAPSKGILTVRFEAEGATLSSETERGTQDQIFYLPDRALAVLDTNFFHHYEFLVRLYDLARPGPQAFTVFIPQEALPGTINVAFLGKENLPATNIPGDLDHFQLTTEEFKIEVWAAPEGKIERLVFPHANLEVLRQK